VAEHLLHDLDVGAGGDGQRGCSVAKLMRLQAGPPDGGGRRGKGGLPEDRPTQRTA
jgi:hypothetical protein